MITDELGFSDDEQIITLSGELALRTVARLRQIADPRFRHVIFDLKAVDHISNRALVAFCATLRSLKAQGVLISLYGADSRLRRVLGLVELSDIAIIGTPPPADELPDPANDLTAPGTIHPLSPPPSPDSRARSPGSTG